MERIIEIKFMYGPWTRVSESSARAFARIVYKGMTNISDPAEKLARINERHVRGVQFTVEDICQSC